MKKSIVLFLFMVQFSNAQSASSLPFKDIGAYPETYTPETVLIRMINGLGYRYYWATEGLRAQDIAYRPTPEAQSVRDLLEHLYGLAETIKNASLDQPNIRPQDFSQLDFESLRRGTLEFLKTAVTAIEKMPQGTIATHEVQFQRPDKTATFPYWHMINGPISDALYHTGQVVSFRRTTGNPIDSSVNVFMGKNNPKTEK